MKKWIIYPKCPDRYQYPYRYFLKRPYRYRYFQECPYRYRYRFSMNVFIDIYIFKSDLIDIDIFKTCRYIDNRYGLWIYRTPLAAICSTIRIIKISSLIQKFTFFILKKKGNYA